MKSMKLRQGRKTGRGFILMAAVSLLCFLLSGIPVYAVGEGNMDLSLIHI